MRETIVTVSAQNSVSPSSTASEPVTMATRTEEMVHSSAYKLRDDKGQPETKKSSLGKKQQQNII